MLFLTLLALGCLSRLELTHVSVILKDQKHAF